MTETPASYESSHTLFQFQYGRILEATGCRTQQELAAVLDVRQSSVSDAKRRGSVPPDWLIKLLKKKRINPEWVMTGEGKQWLQTDAEEAPQALPPVQKISYRPPQECTTDELLAELARRTLKSMKTRR